MHRVDFTFLTTIPAQVPSRHRANQGKRTIILEYPQLIESREIYVLKDLPLSLHQTLATLQVK